MLPRAFELAVLPGHPAHGYPGHHAPPRIPAHQTHHTGASYSTDQIEQLRQQVSSQMDAANLAIQGCSAMSATDVTAWNGIYSTWQAFNTKLQGCTQYGGSGTAVPSVLSCSDFSTGFPFYQWSPTDLNNYAAQANGYQQRVKQACPSYQPPPVPIPVPPIPQPSPAPGPSPSGPGQPGWLCTNIGIGCPAGAPTDTWATAVKWIAIFGILGLTLWYVGPLVAAIAGGTAGAIQRRARGTVGGMGGEEYSMRPQAYM